MNNRRFTAVGRCGPSDINSNTKFGFLLGRSPNKSGASARARRLCRARGILWIHAVSHLFQLFFPSSLLSIAHSYLLGSDTFAMLFANWLEYDTFSAHMHFARLTRTHTHRKLAPTLSKAQIKIIYIIESGFA